MRVNAISNINFREDNGSRTVATENAILMLRDPNASVKFQQNKEVAQKADALNTNPLTALGYKLYRTFSMIRDNEPAPADTEKHLNTLA
jgi:hypothetical protein